MSKKISHYLLTSPAFVAGALLLAGSRISDEDLGTKTVPKKDKNGDPIPGKMEEIKVRPPRDAVEVDENGVPVDEHEADLLAGVVSVAAGVPIAPIQPHAPNPTQPQGAPAQPAGGVNAVEKQLPTEPAQGVESNEAAEARAEQREASEAAAEAIADKAEAPKRRSKGK